MEVVLEVYLGQKFKNKKIIREDEVYRIQRGQNKRKTYHRCLRIKSAYRRGMKMVL